MHCIEGLVTLLGLIGARRIVPLAPLVTLLLEWSSFEAPIVHESFVLFVLKPFLNQIIHFFILQMLHDGRVQTRICYIFSSISQCFC